MAARNALAETLDNMLDFYGVQLQSHAALVIASFAGFFIAIQIWTAVRPPSIWFLLALPIVMSLSVVGAVYCLMRLWMYGKFATAILNGNEKEFEEARSACVGFLPHAQVSYYVSMFFDRNYKTDWWYDLFGPRRQPKRAFLLLVLVVSLMVSYLLISE